MPHPKYYFVKHGDLLWGPIPWQALRSWLGMRWLPPNIGLVAEGSTEAVPASSIAQLWTIAGRPFVAEDPSRSFVAGKLPISAALQQYLARELRWPGDTAGLNYYNGNRLRRELEAIFPDPSRPPLNDPDWPSCMGETPAAELERLKPPAWTAEPVSERQVAVLQFFGEPWEGLTKGKAHQRIEELFSDPQKRTRWESAQTTAASQIPVCFPRFFGHGSTVVDGS